MEADKNIGSVWSEDFLALIHISHTFKLCSLVSGLIGALLITPCCQQRRLLQWFNGTNWKIRIRVFFCRFFRNSVKTCTY